MAPRLVARLTAGLLLVAAGCAEGGDGADDFTGGNVIADAASDASTGYDADSYPTLDAGSLYPVVDAGGTTVDASNATIDAGAKPADAGNTPEAGGGFTFPDIFGEGGLKLPELFPATDAGSTPSTTTDGGRNVNGPCKDLNLLCFDIFDMWINAECQTCNSGKGCQGCAIPFAY